MFKKLKQIDGVDITLENVAHYINTNQIENLIDIDWFSMLTREANIELSKRGICAYSRKYDNSKRYAFIDDWQNQILRLLDEISDDYKNLALKAIHTGIASEMEPHTELSDFYNDVSERIKEYKEYNVSAIQSNDELSKKIELLENRIEQLEKHQIQAQTDEAKKLFFRTKKNEQKLRVIFEKLLKCCYISQNTNLDDWLAVTGKKEYNTNFTPIIWTGTQSELTYLIMILFKSNKEKWEIAKKCFNIKDKDTLNINSMKSEASKINNNEKDKPHSYKDLEELIQNDKGLQ